MSEIHLVFDKTYEPLGEIVCEGGALHSATLTYAGEEYLGLHVSEWQVEGVPILRDRVDVAGSGENIVTSIVRVKRTDPEFALACKEWIVLRGFQVVTLSEDRIPAWEKLLVLPLEPRERFAFALVASALPVGEFVTWLKKIDRSVKRVEKTLAQGEGVLTPKWA